MPQPVEELWHRYVGQVLDVEFRFIVPQALPVQCFDRPVIGGRASNQKNVLRAGLQPQGCLQSLRRLRLFPHSSKVRVELGPARGLLSAGTENNGNIAEECFVCDDHESECGWPDGNDDIWPAVPILARIPLAKFPLGSRVGKESCVKVLAIYLDLVG